MRACDMVFYGRGASDRILEESIYQRYLISLFVYYYDIDFSKKYMLPKQHGRFIIKEESTDVYSLWRKAGEEDGKRENW